MSIRPNFCRRIYWIKDKEANLFWQILQGIVWKLSHDFILSLLRLSVSHAQTLSVYISLWTVLYVWRHIEQCHNSITWDVVDRVFRLTAWFSRSINWRCCLFTTSPLPTVHQMKASSTIVYHLTISTLWIKSLPPTSLLSWATTYSYFYHHLYLNSTS